MNEIASLRLAWMAPDSVTIAQKRADSARRRFKASPASRLKMWGQLASLLKRFDLPTALTIIMEGHSEEGRRRNNLIAMTAETWIPLIRSPQPFADVINGFVSERERLIIAVAQNKTNLAEIMARLHHSEALMHEVKARWRSTLRDPLGLIVMSWIILIGYADLILWQLAQLPDKPRGYALEAQHFCQWLFYQASWQAPLALILIGFAISYLLAHWLSPRRVLADSFWPFSLYKSINAADFLLALGILQSAGEDMPASLRAISTVAGPYLQWQISAIEPILRTKSIGDAVRKSGRRFPDSQINALLDIYSRDDGRNFPSHLARIGEEFSAELRQRMETARKNTNFLALSIAGLLQVLITGLMVAISLPT